MPTRIKEMPKIEEVKLPDEWESLISEAQAAPHFNERVWTPKEDSFLLRARAAGVYWVEICRALHVTDATARKRWRELNARASG